MESLTPNCYEWASTCFLVCRQVPSESCQGEKSILSIGMGAKDDQVGEREKIVIALQSLQSVLVFIWETLFADEQSFSIVRQCVYRFVIWQCIALSSSR